MRVTICVLFCLLLVLVVFALGQEQTSTAIPLRILALNSAEELARVRAELEKGVDFAVLAREKSVDATSLDGGLLGKVDPSTLREEIRTAVRGLAPGQISPLFRLPSGFAIVKVLAPDELAGIAESQRARQAAIRAEGSIRHRAAAPTLVADRDYCSRTVDSRIKRERASVAADQFGDRVTSEASLL